MIFIELNKRQCMRKIECRVGDDCAEWGVAGSVSDYAVKWLYTVGKQNQIRHFLAIRDAYFLRIS